MDSRLRSSRPTFRATSTSSGTGCRQGAIFLRRCGGAIFRKGGGGTGALGISTVADRVAQEVARRCLEPILEPVFHADSYGYRPGKSAIDAVRQARQRCWRCDWVLDLDVRAFFDSIDWELLLKAIRQHTDCPWVLLYVERWLIIAATSPCRSWPRCATRAFAAGSPITATSTRRGCVRP